MSVKLIVVALLAATAVAADAMKYFTIIDVNITVCPNGTENAETCTCTNPTILKQRTHMCSSITGGTRDGNFWMIDNCDDYPDKVLVMESRSDACTIFQKEISRACKPLDHSYMQAECTGTKEDNGNVTLNLNCTSDCNASVRYNCYKSINFTLGKSECHEVGQNKYYKLKGDACPTGFDHIVFQQFTDDACMTSAGADVSYSTTCTPVEYQMSTCTPGEKVTYTTGCTNAACTQGCNAPVDVPLKTFTKVGDRETLYIDSCEVDAPKYTFEQYAGVRFYSKTCAAVDGGFAVATCEGETNTNNNNNTNNNDNDSNNNTNNTASETNTTSTGVIAPAHTVGVLALALCLLACVH